MRRSVVVIVLLLCTVLGATSALAQNAQVTGTVKDSSGGVMPGVTVTAKSNSTGATRSDVSDAAGKFRLVALLPGAYTLTAEIQGFDTQTFSNIALEIDQTATIDFSLKPATVSENVTVTGESPIVDVSRSDVGTALTTQQMTDLPVAARRWIDMAMLTPGSSQDAIRGQFYRGNVSIGAGVTNFFSTGNVVDGVNNTWVEQGETRQNFPMEALEEFKVSTSSYKAEYGFATGGIVNVVTKTGSNDFHASGFLFYRNQELTAKQYFQTTNPPYSRYQEGGSVGGPIVKDKIHYFVTFERTDENLFNSVSTPAWPQYTGTYESQQYRWTYLGRADYQVSQNQSLFVRFGQEYEYRPELTVGGTTIPSSSFDFAVPRTSTVFGHTWIINPKTLNDFRFQYAYSKYEVAPPGSHGDWPAGYFGPDRVNLCTPVYAYPSVTVGGCGNSQMGPEHRYQVKDDIAFQIPGNSWGRHQLKTGFDFSYVPFEEDGLGSPPGTWTFPLDQVYDPNNPKTYPTQYSQSLPTYANLPSKVFATYVQDDWEVSNTVTVNLGLRYDRQIGAYGDTLSANQALTAQLIGQAAVTYPLPVPFINEGARGNANNFGPRVGLAWDATGDGRTNVHAGWGIYYDNMRTLQLGGEITWPQSQSIIISNPCKTNLNCLNDPLNGVPRDTYISTAPPNITVMANDLRSPYSKSFSGGVTRQLTRDVGLSVDYTYVNRYADTNSVNTNLAPAVGAPRPSPQFGRVSTLEAVGNSTYRALFIKMDKRLSNKWSALVSYTLAYANDQPFANDYGNFYGYQQENGPSLADRRNVMRASGTYLLPWDMQFSAILDLRSSPPFNPATSVDINGDGFAIDLPPGVGFRSGCRDMSLDAVNAYRATRGLAAVTTVTCSGYSDLDFRLAKAVRFGDHRIDLIFQLFNVMNTANFATPVSNPLSATFGQVNQILSYINAPSRQAELAIRFQF